MHTLRRPDNQQPQPQSLPQPQLPKPPQSNRMIIKITIQEDPQPQPLLQPQPITVVPPFAFLNHTMKDGKRCDRGRRKATHIPYAAPLRPTLILLYYTIPPLTPNTWPVTYGLSARYSTASATSRGVPSRPIGTSASSSAPVSYTHLTLPTILRV